jgi:hypothetical protein
MKKALGLAAFVLLFGALVAANAEQAPDTLKIEGCGEKQAAVEFDHKAHVARADCATCHHTQPELKADSGIEVTGCRDCHVKPEKAETVGCSEMSMTKNAFHISCVTCHKESVKADATKKAPTKCAECHPKG